MFGFRFALSLRVFGAFLNPHILSSLGGARFTGLSNPHQTTPTHEALETLTSVPTYINQHEQIRNPKQLR